MWVTTTAVVAAVALPFIAAIGWDGYSHASQYISELGARGAPRGGLVSLGFVLVGLLLLAATVLTVTSMAVTSAGGVPRMALVGIALVGGGLGLSYFISGFARCDAGCPESGSLSGVQQVHNTVGVLGYLAAIGGVLLFSIALGKSPLRNAPAWRRIATAGLFAVPLLLTIAILTTTADASRGLLQRLIELILLGWFWAVAQQSQAASTEAFDAGESADQRPR